MKVKQLTPLLLLILTPLTQTANAASISDAVNINLAGSTTLFAADGSLYEVDSASLSSLTQFDTSLGSLNSATLHLQNEDYEYYARIQADGVINSSLSHDLATTPLFGIGAVVPIGGSASLIPSQTTSSSIGCSEGGSSACSDYAIGHGSVFASNTFTGSGMDAFIGTGNLAALDVVLLAGLTYLQHENVTNPNVFFNLSTDFGGGVTVSVDYDYSPVPIPAAIWLFGSALAGLGFVRHKKKPV